MGLVSFLLPGGSLIGPLLGLFGGSGAVLAVIGAVIGLYMYGQRVGAAAVGEANKAELIALNFRLDDHDHQWDATTMALRQERLLNVTLALENLGSACVPDHAEVLRYQAIAGSKRNN